MATVEVQQPPPEPSAAVPDYLASPNATLGDQQAQWRYGRPPDYSKTRKVWEETKQMNHAAGSLPQLVENLVKNWEVEASFKPKLSDWRTIDHENYTFAINGGPPQTAEHMLKVGTYNAIIAPNEFYSPEHSDFASSHKTFKRMMPTFAWEVLEVYSGPPQVAFRWRHWGTMKDDYVGFNDKGEKITAKAHGGPIDITGVTIATVDDKVRLQSVNTYFDPLDMFRQIAPGGIVNRDVVDQKMDRSAALDPALKPTHDGIKIAEEHNDPDDEHARDAASADTEGSDSSEAAHVKPPQTDSEEHNDVAIGNRSGSLSDTWEEVSQHEHSEGLMNEPRSQYSSSVTGKLEDRVRVATSQDDSSNSLSMQDPLTIPKTMEERVKPDAGEAVVAPIRSEETRMTHEELSKITPAECPFMNRE